MKSVVKKINDHYFGDIFAFLAKISPKYPTTSFYEKALQGNNSALVIEDDKPTTVSSQESVLKSVSKSSSININIIPNPIGHHATITLDLPKTDQISMAVYDTNGRLIQTLFSKRTLETGHHLFDLPGADLPEGIYILSIQTEAGVQSVRFVR